MLPRSGPTLPAVLMISVRDSGPLVWRQRYPKQKCSQFLESIQPGQGTSAGHRRIHPGGIRSNDTPSHLLDVKGRCNQKQHHFTLPNQMSFGILSKLCPHWQNTIM